MGIFVRISLHVDPSATLRGVHASLSPPENDPTILAAGGLDLYFGLNGAGLAKRAASIAAFGRTPASSIMFCPLVQVTRM